jgi:O-antigen/teichoic acid export membrane protein
LTSQRIVFFNSLSGTALYVVNIAVVFILSPILLRALGNSAYGLWELIMSVVGYMGLLDLGIGSAMVRYVAVADGKGDRDDMAKTMATSLVFFAAMGMVASAIFAVLGFYPGLLAGGEAIQIAGVQYLFYLFAVNALFLFPMQVFLATLLGIQCHYFINFSRMLFAIIKSIITYWYITTRGEHVLLFISVVELTATLLSFFVFYVFLYAKKEIPGFSLHSISREKFKDLFVFGSKNLVMMAASRLQNQSVPIIIANVVGVSSIVYYAFPNRLVDYAKGFASAIGTPLTPYFSSVVGRGRSSELRNTWLQTTFVLQAIMFIMPVVLWQYGEVFLRLWIGLEYAEAGRWVIKLLVIGLVADALAANSFRLLTAQASHGKVAVLWLILAALSIPTGVLCGKIWGIEGVTLAVVLVSVVGKLATVMFACASLNITQVEYFRATCMKLILPLVMSAGCSALLLQFYTITSYFDLICHVALVCSLYCLLFWMFSVDAVMKKTVLKKLSYKFKK